MERPRLEFSAPFVPGVSTHGTGCTYSAAIAARLALGDALEEAIARAKNFVSDAIRRTFLVADKRQAKSKPSTTLEGSALSRPSFRTTDNREVVPPRIIKAR